MLSEAALVHGTRSSAPRVLMPSRRRSLVTGCGSPARLSGTSEPGRADSRDGGGGRVGWRNADGYGAPCVAVASEGVAAWCGVGEALGSGITQLLYRRR